MSELSIPPAGLCHATEMRKAARHITNFYDTVIAPCGLRSTQRSIMMQIARADSPRVTDLAEALVLDRTALTHNLQPLVRDGLVTVASTAGDKRVRVVKLTPFGVAKLQESNMLWQRAQLVYEAAFGDGDASTLRDALGRVASLELRHA